MMPIVVVPCLNEVESLDATIASLGFGTAGGAGEALLVLVDNGSTDGTLSLMGDIADRSRVGASIRIASEPSRGFVPARRAGILAARAMAAEHGIADDDALILQADADTCYAPGYISAMTAAAIAGGPGHLYEGRNSAPAEGEDPYPDFQALARIVDGSIEPLLGDIGYDVVVDDKVAGFRISDYLRWGAHRREFTAAGEEILAETTRLFIRARLLGDTRIAVEDASAVTSQRRTLDEPALAFATAGYPYAPPWCERWLARYEGTRALQDFAPPASRPAIDAAARERKRHLVALFGLLPHVIESRIGHRRGDALSATYAEIERRLGFPDARTAAERPGLLLERALAIDDQAVMNLAARYSTP